MPAATCDLARYLIGTILVRRLDSGELLAGRIVETEAYTPGDPASHAYRGESPRNRAMFGPHMHAYVYFIYGSVFCLNLTSEAVGIGAAVLIRALEPLHGIEAIQARRGTNVPVRDLARGPGRICLALEIDRRLDGIDLDRDQRLWLADDGQPKPALGVSARIGLSKETEVRLRYYARGSRYLSGPRALSP